MTAELIYGHKGMQTYRTAKGIVQVVHGNDGDAAYQVNMKGLHNAAEKLRMLDGSGFTPTLLRITDRMMLQEDLGLSETTDGWTPDDWQDFRRALVRILLEIRRRKLRHGDLNGNNIIIRDKMPWVIDWQESHFLSEKPPQLSPMSDAHWICSNIRRWIGNEVISDPYRVIRRWAYIYGDLYGRNPKRTLGFEWKGKTFLDAGCFQGDFSALAAAEGFNVIGVDPGGFRHGEDSITIARRLWDGVHNLSFALASIHSWESFGYDVILFMDTFPYVIRDFGVDTAIKTLNRMVAQGGRVYFETQMDGDQSGISWLRTDDDVKALVPNADWTKIITIPENGIGRTVWRIECKRKD